MATIKHQGTGRTHASAVSKQLRRLGYAPYGASETRWGGYVVKDWESQKDTQGGRIVRVSYEGVHRELKGPAARKDAEREKARLERVVDMMEDLKTLGYFVVWGWDENDKNDNSFVAVSGSPARQVDTPKEEEVVVAQEPTPEPVQAPEPPVQEDTPPQTAPVEPVHPRGAFPLIPLMALEDAEDGVRTVQEVAKTDPEAARRMEGHLYYLALVAVVSGTPDAVDVAATVLQTQGTLLPR